MDLSAILEASNVLIYFVTRFIAIVEFLADIRYLLLSLEDSGMLGSRGDNTVQNVEFD